MRLLKPKDITDVDTLFDSLEWDMIELDFIIKNYDHVYNIFVLILILKNTYVLIYTKDFKKKML